MSSLIQYQHPDHFLVAVDCIIFGFHETELKVLSFKRKMEPFMGESSLMGGFVHANESVLEAAERVLFKLTGIHGLYMEQVGTYGNVNRDPVQRVVSVAYVALINLADYDSHLMEEHNAEWISLTACNNLILDHKKMVADAITLLRRRAAAFQVGFNLLPEKFTLSQLQALYEAIYNEPMDKRNFRKKVLSLDIMKRLDEKDKIHSRKGAFFYSLTDKYLQSLRAENISLHMDC